MTIWAFIVGAIEIVLLIKNMALIGIIIQIILNAIILWLAVRYSAFHINKKYVIDDYKKVAYVSMLCEVIYVLIANTIAIAAYPTEFITSLIIISAVIVGIIQIAIFYLTSKKYIKNTEPRSI